MRKIILRHRNLQLLITLFALFFFLPFLNQSKLSGLFLTLFLSLILFFGVLVADTNKKVFRPVLILGLLALVTNWWNAPYIQTRESVMCSGVANLLFLGFIAAIILKRIFDREVVDENSIYGAGCVYILMGLCWALIFSLIEFFSPGSFKFPNHTTEVSLGAHHALFFEFFYFSFVTITTLGYGDIVPVAKMAKMLSILESLIGQLFIALLVARLVGLYTANRHSQLEKKARSG